MSSQVWRMTQGLALLELDLKSPSDHVVPGRLIRQPRSLGFVVVADVYLDHP